jgi:hypothetical protein
VKIERDNMRKYEREQKIIKSYNEFFSNWRNKHNAHMKEESKK